MGALTAELRSPRVPSPHYLFISEPHSRREAPVSGFSYGFTGEMSSSCFQNSQPPPFPKTTFDVSCAVLCALALPGGCFWQGQAGRVGGGWRLLTVEETEDFALGFKSPHLALGKRSLHPTEEKGELVTTRDTAMGSGPLPVASGSCCLFFCLFMGRPAGWSLANQFASALTVDYTSRLKTCLHHLPGPQFPLCGNGQSKHGSLIRFGGASSEMRLTNRSEWEPGRGR